MLENNIIDEKDKCEVWLENCTFVKTILMVIVIFGHSIAFWSGSWFAENPMIVSSGLNYLYRWVNSFHVYAFTLVSGYIFAHKVSGGGIAHIYLSSRIRLKDYWCRMPLQL